MRPNREVRQAATRARPHGTAAVAFVALGRAGFGGAAFAQDAADDGPDACTAAGRRIGRFVSRKLDWENRRPRVERVRTLGDGEVWYAVDMGSCCSTGETCGGSSEADDALVGAAGDARFLLTPQELPAIELAPVEPWDEPLRLDGWSRFLAAASAGPETTEEAQALARLIAGDLRPGLGLVPGEDDLQAILAAKTDSVEAAAAARENLRRDGADIVESRADPRDGGFDAVIWLSDFAPDDDAARLRGSSSGFSSSDALQRLRLRIENDGAVSLVEDVAFVIPGSGVGRSRPQPQVGRPPLAVPGP
ncbi:MAG: hypothetical protein HY907_06235 [Deltaproteobacteria bacterium]|nr:hypothetical protein [Deltaproteobacteria bacterium]